MMLKNRFISLNLLIPGMILFVLLGTVTSCALVSKVSGGAGHSIDPQWVSIAAGKSHSLAVKSDGTLWAWGGNEVGQLGDGTIKMKNSPVQIGRDDQWTAVVAGYFHTVALKSDGTLWSWGINEYGQLGDGTTDEKYLPVQIDRMNVH
jgi:alpha-tubulin suppressor-like RCC1 family protein